MTEKKLAEQAAGLQEMIEDREEKIIILQNELDGFKANLEEILASIPDEDEIEDEVVDESVEDEADDDESDEDADEDDDSSEDEDDTDGEDTQSDPDSPEAE